QRRPVEPQETGPRRTAKIALDNQLSDSATVIEVKCPDRLGLLYLITRALAGLGLDIVSARIATEIDQAFDTFYVQDREGRKLEDRTRSSAPAWGSSRRSRSPSDDAGALPRARARLDRPCGPRPVPPAPPPHPPDGHRPRGEFRGCERILRGPHARGGAPPDRRRALRLLRRRARPRLRPGDPVRGLS